nr:unnamed protein product [Callosobruchus analis]
MVKSTQRITCGHRMSHGSFLDKIVLLCLMSLFPKTLTVPSISAVDGKRIDIIPPSRLYFYNYKGRHSMVLLAVVVRDTNL